MSAQDAVAGGEQEQRQKKLRERLLESLSRPVSDYIKSKVSDGMIDWLFGLVLPEDIVQAVANGDDLITLFVKSILKAFPREVEESMDPRMLFDRLRAKHPELASVILNVPGGAEWFFSAVEKVRMMARETGRLNRSEQPQ